jgi:hypothetical protein
MIVSKSTFPSQAENADNRGKVVSSSLGRLVILCSFLYLIVKNYYLNFQFFVLFNFFEKEQRIFSDSFFEKKAIVSEVEKVSVSNTSLRNLFG